MTSGEHLTNELLVRAIDDELPVSEVARVTAHLSQCLECERKHQELRLLSSRIETLVARIAVVDMPYSERESLKKRLELQRQTAAPAHGTEKVLRRFGWGLAIAATLAIGVVFAPQTKHVSSNRAALSQSRGDETFEIDGETFVALPYSNADLPLSAPHIMQMRIPVSSLSAAGVAFEPIATEVSPGGDSVLADVLLGIDGQPLGVHVTGVE
jgi:anti-sigma factor RsiW